VRTFGLEEAAAFVGLHPHTLEEKARNGEVPAAKPGKRWIFIDIDLAEWLRSQYRGKDDEKGGEAECHYTGEVVYGGVAGASRAAKSLQKALERPTGKRRRNTTTADVLPFGTR
jgi:excisionase family DNA binding protein